MRIGAVVVVSLMLTAFTRSELLMATLSMQAAETAVLLNISSLDLITFDSLAQVRSADSSLWADYWGVGRWTQRYSRARRQELDTIWVLLELLPVVCTLHQWCVKPQL